MMETKKRLFNVVWKVVLRRFSEDFTEKELFSEFLVVPDTDDFVRVGYAAALLAATLDVDVEAVERLGLAHIISSKENTQPEVQP
jgi:hypothetical protein